MVIAALAVFVLVVAASCSFYHVSGDALAGKAAVAATPEKQQPFDVARQVANFVTQPKASVLAALRPLSRSQTAHRPGVVALLEAWGSVVLHSYAEMFASRATSIVAQRLDVPFPPAEAHHIARPLALVYRSMVYAGSPFDLVLYILAPGRRGADLVPPDAKDVDVQTTLSRDLEFDAAEDTPLIAVALDAKNTEFAVDAGGATLLKRLGPADVAYHFLVKPTLAQTCILTLTISYVTPSASTTEPHSVQSYPVMSIAVPIAVKTVANLSAGQLQGVRWIAGTIVTLVALGFFLTIAPASDGGTVRILGLLAVAAQLGLPVSDKLSALLPKA